MFDGFLLRRLVTLWFFFSYLITFYGEIFHNDASLLVSKINRNIDS